MSALARISHAPIHLSPNRRRVGSVALATALLTPLGVTTPAIASAPQVGSASVITDWNRIAVAALLADTSKLVQEDLLYVGFVNAAVYDAVVGIDGRYRPYLLHARAPRGASDQAAAVAAAHKVLVTYVPTQREALDADYAASLAKIPDGHAETAGIAYGERAADALIASRVGDGRNAKVTFDKAPAPGVWRPTPPGFLDMAVPWLGGVKPLLVRSGAQFGEPGPPPALTSRRYTRDFVEVEEFGSKNSTERTAEQTTTALFFSGNPLVQYDTALGDQVTVRQLDIVDAARMFAVVNMSMADALISVWHAKLLYGFWRPITAIREADTDGNPATVADRDWTPLIPTNTPPYPDYVSGYSGVTGAFTRALAETFTTRHLQVSLISTAVPGTTRQYDSGKALRDDVVSARVWLGIHFRTADVRGVNMGQQVARYALAHYFQPVKKGHR